jgi:hypothetical protein
VAQLRAEKIQPDGKLAPETGCSVTFPLNPRSKSPTGFWVMFGDQDNPQWGVDRQQGLVEADYRWEIGKIGSDACTPDGKNGWIAFSNAAQGLAFTERFPIFRDQQYPDDGSTVECWTVGKGKVANLDYETSEIYLMETEVLSPIYEFQPGESHTFSIDWGACRSSGRILDVQSGSCCSQKLSAQVSEKGVRLNGVFGVFDVGNLLLTWLDGSGEASGSVLLDAVSPADPVILDQIFQPPVAATGVEVSVLADADGAVRILGKCEL